MLIRLVGSAAAFLAGVVGTKIIGAIRKGLAWEQRPALSNPASQQ